MKPLPFPRIRDKVVLRTLAMNTQLAIYPELQANLAPIHAQYAAYWGASGNPAAANAPQAIPLTDLMVRGMKRLYTSPPTLIRKQLDNVRDRGSVNVCPMCGSLKTGSLDHVFPKNTFPEFSIFSKNLVPACDCNSKRGESYMGANPGERVLHPYFDLGLNRRLIRATLTAVNGSFRTPIIGLEVCIPQADPLFPAVRYHLNNVILKNNVIAYLEDLWLKLFRLYEDYFRLPAGNFSDADILGAVDETCARYDRQHDTPNNWGSMLFAGLANNLNAKAYLAQEIRRQRAQIIAPDQF